MLKRRLQQEFFNRETERQRRMMEEEERDKGMIYNETSGQFDYMVQAQPTPTPFVDTLRRISPDNLDKPRRIMGDPNNPSVPVRQAAIGGQILPQVQSTLAGAGIGANAFPASPQEAFLNTPITGSVLQNLGNAVPLGAMQQPQQQAGFMQPMAQKKNPEIARFSFASGGDVDWDFISSLEGTKLEGYIPEEKGKPIDKSGVTIGSGFDLGQQNEDGLRKMGISEELIKKFKPYLGKDGLEAQETLKNTPLNISESEHKAMMPLVKKTYYNRVRDMYNRAGKLKFESLTPAQRTIVTSVAFQYGDLETKTPNFYKQITQGSWTEAIKNLMNFGDKYKTRREKEAEYLQNRI